MLTPTNQATQCRNKSRSRTRNIIFISPNEKTAARNWLAVLPPCSTSRRFVVFSRAFQRPTGADQRLPSGSSLVAGGPTACLTSCRKFVLLRKFQRPTGADQCFPSGSSQLVGGPTALFNRKPAGLRARRKLSSPNSHFPAVLASNKCHQCARENIK